MAAQTASAFKKTPLEELADQTGLPLSWTNNLLKDMATDMLLTIIANVNRQADTLKKFPTNGDDASVLAKGQTTKAKAFEALKELYPNGKFMDTKHLPPPFLELGIPGHGKTTVVREAARLVAKLMNYDFLDNPGSHTPITENSYVFMSVEFAGQNSAFSYKGVPIKRVDAGETDDDAYMDYLRERLFTKMDVAAGGVMLMDDIGNANGALMNAALPMLEERRYNRTDMSKMYVAATGNLGSLDGTKISGYSSALLGRAKVVLVRDNVDDLAARIREEFAHDEISDCFISGFIKKMGQEFIEQVPKAGQLTPVPSPRSLTKAVIATRIELMKAGGPEFGVSALMPMTFNQNVGSLLGTKGASDLSGYLQSCYEHAEPAARQLMETGNIHPTFEKHLNNPTDQDAVMFFEQFSRALADHAFEHVKGTKSVKEKKFADSFNRFAEGLFEMPPVNMSNALSWFKERLTSEIPEYGKKPAAGQTRRVFTQEAYEGVVDLLRTHPKSSQEDWKAVVDIISEAGLYDINTTPVAANPGAGAAPRARNNVKKAATANP